MTGFKDHWDDKANKSRNHHVGHHGHKDDDAQIRIAIHVGNNKGRKDATDHTIHKAHENAFQDAFFIAMKLDVPNGNAANDHSQGLGSRVSAHTGYNGHGSGKGHDLRNGIFKHGNRGGRQKGRHEIDKESGQPHMDRFQGRTVHIFFLVDTAQFEHVFRIFFFNDIDDIINGDDADDAHPFIDNRNGVQVVF